MGNDNYENNNNNNKNKNYIKNKNNDNDDDDDHGNGNNGPMESSFRHSSSLLKMVLFIHVRVILTLSRRSLIGKRLPLALYSVYLRMTLLNLAAFSANGSGIIDRLITRLLALLCII